MRRINVAKVIVRDTQNQYLVLRSSEWPENPERSLQPDIAGGMVEESETHQLAAVRELFEETGIVVKEENLELGFAHSENLGNRTINRLIFLANVDNPEIILSDEHDKFWWSSYEEMAGLKWRHPYPDIFEYLYKAGFLG